MKRYLFLTFVLVCAASVLASGGEVVLEVTGVNSEEGQVVVGLYEEGSFTETGEEKRGAKIEAEPGTLTLKFEGVPQGEYAVSLFHDRNGNGELDSNFVGIPDEAYGFSKNVYNWYGGPPDFEKASFSLDKEETVTLSVKVRGWPPV